MSGIYRSMIDEGGKPVIGDKARMLGVRTNGTDIPIDGDGSVQPGTGGLSVSPNWQDLPLFLIPRRLQSIVKDARGNNRLACFRLSDFSFAAAQIDEQLWMRPDSVNHGIIEPTYKMKFDDYQRALAATRDSWAIDEN
jgi:hypothetical protein